VVGKPVGRSHLEDLGVDGSIILEGILEKYGNFLYTEFVWFGGLGQSSVARFCDYGIGISSFIK
jgi:hypothetical protein